jgi:5-methylcytosine-specific restriction protein B
MSLDTLVDIVHTKGTDKWRDRNQEAFEALFGAPGGRYPKAAEKVTALRAPEMSTDDGVPFAAYIHVDNPKSGPYSGLSFVIFPIEDGPCLVGLGVGTQGLPPDEAILGRPGHARKVRAIVDWLNKDRGNGKRIAWAKHDPTRTDISIPDELQKEWSSYASIFKRYGRELYALFVPSEDKQCTQVAIASFLDLMMEERGFAPMNSAAKDAEQLRTRWFAELMPQTTEDKIAALLENRGYVILQGPPGTGKTRMASKLLHEHYKDRGQTIQFHPNTSYENFIGGLAPVQAADTLGLQFRPTAGFLMQAIADAKAQPELSFLLHIDEINRADLGKVLGEAILLLEWKSDSPRTVRLPYDFGPPFGSQLQLPANLHILGTMNTADRSIAIVDLAVRRRFGFISIWPDQGTVEKYGCALMQKAYRDILSIFVEYASDDAFQLIPGHAYFLESDETMAKERLKTNLAPLLDEYLSQGFVGGFAEDIRSFLQWLRSL